MEKEFVTLHLGEIYPYDNNPRLNDDAVADVIASIQQCENLDPIEIDEENVILSGHTRLKALLKLGYETTECVRYIGLTEEQKRKYRLLANKTGEKAEWDLDKLEVELADLDFDGFDFGFDLDLPDTDFRQFLIDAFTTADSVMRKGAVFYIWHADTEGYNFRYACREAGWTVRECLIWNKDKLVLGRQDYHWKHEPCQPAGTMIWTPEGEKPIESLRDGDKVISFDTLQSQVKGYKNGYEIKTASRHYEGTLYGINADGKTTWATDNHEFSVRFNPDAAGKWSTYLMRNEKGWWRVGITRTYDARGFGLKHRVVQEHAVEAWIIQTYDSQANAQMGEQYLSIKYGIPYTHWEAERGCNDTYQHRTSSQIEWLYNQMDLDEMQKAAERLLEDNNRSIKYPLIDRKSQGERFSRRETAKINACNLIPGLMMVPIPYKKYEGNDTFFWAEIDELLTKPYDDTVYSLAVQTHQHYISDGIVTHNCLYGWKDGASHLWASDRKQTTVLNFERPNRNDLHPTMKPISLISYQIGNNTHENDAVLDLFGGSGSTLIACEQMNRQCYMQELDEKYTDVIIQRYINFKGDSSDVYLIRDGKRIPYAEVGWR